jgi:hypothetical protein
MREESKYSFNWTAWVTWVLITTLGWLIGWIFLGELWIGLALGAAQWLLLRTRLKHSYWWIPASLVGWAIGHLAVLNFVPVDLRDWAGLPIGLTLGTAQWIVLRDEMPHTFWWIVVNGLGWMLALTGVLGGSLVGAVAGAVTGVAAALFVDLQDRVPTDQLDQD